MLFIKPSLSYRKLAKRSQPSETDIWMHITNLNCMRSYGQWADWRSWFTPVNKIERGERDWFVLSPIFFNSAISLMERSQNIPFQHQKGSFSSVNVEFCCKNMSCMRVYTRILRHLERKKRHSFPLRRYGGSFRSMICEQMLRMQIRFVTISCEIALMWIPGKKIEDKWILVQLMAWCR